MSDKPAKIVIGRHEDEMPISVGVSLNMENKIGAVFLRFGVASVYLSPAEAKGLMAHLDEYFSKYEIFEASE
jgi:hypothetical protein